MERYRLSALFAKARGSSGRDMERDSLERELRARVEAGRLAWPGIELDESAFVGQLARHADRELPPLNHAAELWLVSACACGIPAAIVALEQRYRGIIEGAAARIHRRTVDDATQVVLTSLLVREGAAPARITAYGGRSALSTWLATVSARAALKLQRGRAQRSGESPSGVTYAVSGNPELRLLQAKYGPEVEAALREAISELEARPCVLLRLHHAEGWSLPKIASLYGVSRATAARWLAAARQDIYDGTKRHLRARLRVTSSEFASIANLVGAELDVSLVRWLDKSEPGDDEREGARGQDPPPLTSRR